MLRSLFVCTCALLAIPALPCGADQTNTPAETRVRLTVSPAKVPVPALRYLFLPEFEETNPGNPCHGYLKCFMDQQKFFFDKESVQRREQLLAMPLKELPAAELLNYGGEALRQADWAARLDTPDWQILLRVKSDGPAVLLPDLQQLEPLANALKVRFRAEVALSRFDDAIRTARTILAMARHLSDHPTLPGYLQGYPIAIQAIGALEEMLQQPGCPNLYWALTNLPHPLVRFDRGLGNERDVFVSLFRGLDVGAPMSPEQLERYVAPLDQSLGGNKPAKPGGVRAWLELQARDENIVRAARRRLVEYGLSEERISRFPAQQVILLDEKREYEVRRDDLFKLMNLPMHQAIALIAQIKPSQERTLFVDPLLEGLPGIIRPQARFDRRIALLRHVEALRLYAAEHNGTLPATLAAVSVPLPDDPFTGAPFRYDLVNGTAHLRGTPPPGEQTEPLYNVHYEVTIAQ